MTTHLSTRVGAVAVAVLTSATLALSAAPAQAAGDLAGLWTFTDGGGQVVRDWSFSGNSGTLGSTPQVDTHDPQRIRTTLLPIASGLGFDGDDYVRVPDAPSLEPDGVTVVVRIRADASPGPFRYVVSKGALACKTASYGLYTGADGNLRFYASDGSVAATSAASAASLWDGRWHTVVGTFSAGKVRLSVDRTDVGAAVPTDLAIRYGLPDGDALVIGDYAGPCGGQQLGFVGDLDGVAVIGNGQTSSPWSLVS